MAAQSAVKTMETKTLKEEILKETKGALETLKEMEMGTKLGAMVRIPEPGEKIFKDECAFSFDSPESDGGLFVCMNTFLGFGRHTVETHFAKTGNAVYLHMRRVKREAPSSSSMSTTTSSMSTTTSSSAPSSQPKNREGEEEGGGGGGKNKKTITRLAIGVEGGFEADPGNKYEFEDLNSVVILPDFVHIPLPEPRLPDKVQLAVSTILSSDSANKMEEAKALAGTWDGEKRLVTKHADSLVQVDNGVRVPPRGWKCGRCDKTDNLWLNLTDGSILCGRPFFDGSGGNGHAIDHYRSTGYPLAVKIGTITPDGADVFSYDEDEMVEDPHLAKHLAHFGINISQMEKTDKSMIELEIDINQRIGEWATIQEAGSQLVPLFGSGYTGLSNLGNSCYLNSVMQVIFSIPDFQRRYIDYAQDIFEKAPVDPTNDFTVQMAKLGYGLLSGRYSQPPPPGSDAERESNEIQQGIKPTMFKTLIGKGHAEFSTKRQQDAQEFFLHLINVLERNNRGHSNPAECFKFKGEERIQCLASGKVKYTYTTEYILRLPIPLDLAINKAEVQEYEAKKLECEAKGLRVDAGAVVRARIPLSSCLEVLAAPKTVHDFFSTAIKSNCNAVKVSRMGSFPDYLMVQLEKFTFENGWIPKKLDVSIEVPDELDLTWIRGNGLQPGEEPLPEDPIPAAAGKQEQPSFVADPNLVAQLVDMGFPVDACHRAAYSVGVNDPEAMVNWLTEHVADSDFAAPFTPPGGSSAAHRFVADTSAIYTILGMGFTREQAEKALRNTDNNVERAVDWIFSHIGELDSCAMEGVEATPPEPQFNDGSGKYRLVAFISHMGTSTMVGHYVCHIFKDGRWVIYNDNKVALSENPPKDLGYLYLFQRQ